MEYTVKKYDSSYFTLWDELIENAKNGTFLFRRGFMEYHSDRFEDYSLLVFHNNRLVAVLPANRVGDEVFSHQGLTYGGLVYGPELKLTGVVTIFMFVLQFLNSENVTKLHLKLIPCIYHKQPSEEINYALFLVNATLERRDTLSVINLYKPVVRSKDRKEGVKRGVKNNLVIVEEPEFELFWDKILLPNLYKKHGTVPVHTAREMKMLYQRFPENIKHFNVYRGNEIVAGTTFFVSETVAHSQYTSAAADKNETGSLDFLYHHLITNVFADRNYFDFGISNEQQGRKLNGGLSYWKESFGARTIVQDFYEVETGNYKLANDFLI